VDWPPRGYQIMTRRRWIADEVSGNRAVLLGSHAHHLAVVLRARTGQQFDIATGDTLRAGRITSVSPDRVEFELGEELTGSSVPHIGLLMAVFKFDRMEWAIEKCTELGISRIIPLIAQRTEVHLARAAGKRVERWQRIARQASEQARRRTSPLIEQPVRLKDAAVEVAPTRLLLAESERGLTLKDALQSHSPDHELLLALGPEGGWTNDEIATFSQAGWTAASLGNTILRAETGAIAATAIAIAELS
jgi:16S rRNA (uracil1498-N3)-methyltransferase